MKYLIPILSMPLMVILAGCNTAATEEEKRNFSRQVLEQENQQQRDEFRRAVDEEYIPSVGNPPAWETPVN